MSKGIHMKNLNLFKKVAIVAALSVTAQSQATDVNVPLAFKTLPVIKIETKKELNFGSVLTLAQADECTMSTSSGGSLTASDEGQDLATITGGGGSNVGAPSGGALTDDCAGAPDGQPGVYEIESFEGADIVVDLNPGTATDILLEPAGYVVNMKDDLTTANTSTRDPLTVSTDATVRASGTLTAFSPKGTNRVIIGGKIINQNALSPDGEYETDFTIDVTYQ